ncbi:MAG: hypothetical protein ABSE54_10025 [Smithella sp.]|jgi:hypothetical protein
MTSTASSLSRYFLGSQVPWSFRLLVLLFFLLIGGGIYLDKLALEVSYPDVFASSEVKVDPTTKQESRIEKVGLSTEDRQFLIQWAKEKTQRLNESAKLLYDFAKVVLGALIASLTQLISGGIKQSYGGGKEQVDGVEGGQT